MSSFDILDYLNDMYLQKQGSTISIFDAGGQQNIHGKANNKVDETILEINKKRIHIPNAQINKFSDRYRVDDEEHNEPETSSTTELETGEDGDTTSDPLAQTASVEVVQI